jgi:pSer/pThr/pTyr-binding forkhead associated (FHA) protein
MPYLSVRTEERGAATRVQIKGVAVIGRSKGCDVVIDDKQSSRRHARVFSDGRQYFVEDLDSRNGTLLNGGKIAGRHPIQDGDEIRIGAHRMKFEDERAAPASDRALPTRRSSGALAEARETVSGAFASFFMLIITVLVFGATTVVSWAIFRRILGGD